MIERWIKRLSYWLALVAGAALLLMMVQTVMDVLMANFFGRPISGNLEVISIYHMVLVVFLPLAYVETKHEHIAVELLVQLMPKTLYRMVLAFGYLLSAGFFAILAFQTWLDAVRSFEINEIMMGAVYVTIWPAKFALPVGFVAIMLPTLMHAWKALTDPEFTAAPATPGIAGDQTDGGRVG